MSTVLIALSICFATFLLLLIKTWWMNWSKFYNLAANFEKPPGYSCYPLIGHLHHYVNHQAIIKIASSFTQAHGVVYMASTPLYYLNDANLIEDCLSSYKCLNKPNFGEILRNMQNSIFLAQGKEWKERRNVLMPAFKTGIINHYAKILTKCDIELTEQFSKNVGHVFDPSNLVLKYTFNKYFECAFGFNIDAKSEEYLNALKTGFKTIEANLYNVNGIPFINKIIGNDKAFDDNLAIIKRITEEVVVQRLKITEEETNDSLVDDGEYKELIFIDHILECTKSGKYEECNMVSDLVSFIFAAVDSSVVTFLFLCVCLGMYPDVQDKVYEEIEHVISDRPFHYSDFPNLKYLQMAIKETLRLFPPAPILQRTVAEDVKIGDYVFPKDSHILVNVINVHRSPKYYPKPLEFVPERFAPESEAVKTRPRFAYVPFAAGKRHCIGERFAMMSTVSTAVTMFKKFRFETTYKSIEEVKLESIFNLSAVNGFPLRIHPRI